MYFLKKALYSIAVISVFVASSFVFSGQVQGQAFNQACQGKAASSEVCRSSSDNPLYGPNGVITRVSQIIIIVVAVAAVITIIIAGMKYILSAGDPNSVNNAKNTILYAVIGLVVAMLGQAIVSFVLTRLN